LPHSEGENRQQPTELKSFFSADKQRYSFYFDLAADKTPEKVDVYLEARTVTEEALLIAIDECNARLRKSGVELAREVSLYKVRLVGRNFKPKTDMPCTSSPTQACPSSRRYATSRSPNSQSKFPAGRRPSVSWCRPRSRRRNRSAS
jgi:hypothetical protein